jgi:hypothetical protein
VYISLRPGSRTKALAVGSRTKALAAANRQTIRKQEELPFERSFPWSAGPSSARAGTNNHGRKERTSSHGGRRPRSVPMGNADQVRHRQPFQSERNCAAVWEGLPTRPTRASTPPQLRRASQAQKLAFAWNPSIDWGEPMIAVPPQDKMGVSPQDKKNLPSNQHSYR